MLGKDTTGWEEKEQYLEVLWRIHDILSKKRITWAVTGSMSFALRGIPCKPKDIDIQTDKTEAYHIQELLSRCMKTEVTIVKNVELTESETLRSHFGTLKINGIKVEIMGALQKRDDDGGWEEPVDIKDHIEYVEVKSKKIPVLSLEYEAKAYEKLGRTETTRKIRRYLKYRDTKDS